MIRKLFLLVVSIGVIGFCFLTGSRIEWFQSKQDSVPSFPTVSMDFVTRNVENKPFVIIFYAHNAENWCERALHSIFEQDYSQYRVIFVDDASIDRTQEKVQQYIIQNEQDHRVIVMHNDEKMGPLGSLYRASDTCSPKEIVVYLDAESWLSHENALKNLNCAFQNASMWACLSDYIDYPTYQIAEQRALPFPLAFYAFLIQSIPLSTLVDHGVFHESLSSISFPLLSRSTEHVFCITDPLFFHHEEMCQKSASVKSIDSFLAHTKNLDVDLCIFSYDRPMQLYCALESINRYVSHCQSLIVLYRTSDDRFQAAYQIVKNSFPRVKFIHQSDDPLYDYQPLLLKTISESTSDYFVFGVDDMVITDAVDLKECSKILDKTGAYAFYLQLGSNIDRSYVWNRAITSPPHISIGLGVLAWDVFDGEADWGRINNIDLTLYRKKDLLQGLSDLHFHDPLEMEKKWSSIKPSNRLGLFYERSRVVIVPFNIVQPNDSPQMNFMTPEELLMMFNQGYKIDVEPFFHVENSSPHVDVRPTFIQR